MRVAFLGRGKLGMNVLTRLLDDSRIEVPVIITCKSTPEVEYPEEAFKEIATKHNIKFIKTNRINQSKYTDILNDLNIDLSVALLWLYKIQSDIINTSKKGFINCHSGLLPKYRGNACGNWSIINGENTFGITTHFMKAGELDNGDIINQVEVPITDSTTIKHLVSAFHEKGAESVINAVNSIYDGSFVTKSQSPKEASYCYPRIESDGEIDWNQSALQISRLVRAAGKPYQGAYTWFKDIRDGFLTKKMIVHDVDIIEHEFNEFHAVPGHLIKNEDGDYLVVCGDKKLVLLKNIEISGVFGKGSDFFNTVRQRLGLDQSTMIYDLENRMDDLEKKFSSSNDLSSHFLKSGYQHLEKYEHNVNYIIDEVFKKLENQYNLEKNPLRNYSFQKRFYNWEQRERWFGVQIYRSFRYKNIQDEPLALGAWYFTQEKTELRIYLSVKPEYKSEYRSLITSLLKKLEKTEKYITYFPDKGDDCEAAFVVVSDISSAINILQNLVVNIGKGIRE
jgi:methionyl-tRNA formyltransferase